MYKKGNEKYVRVTENESLFFLSDIGTTVDVEGYTRTDLKYLYDRAKKLKIKIQKRKNKITKLQEKQRPIKVYGVPDKSKIYLFI